MAHHTGQCAHCETTFSRERAGGPAPRYCSANCRAAAKHRRDRVNGAYVERLAREQAQRVPIRHECTCAICGSSFQSRQLGTKYCSKPCRNQANYLRQRDSGYRTRYRKENPLKPELRPVPCAVCGEVVMRGPNARYRATACSSRCISYLRNRKWPSTPVSDRHPSRSTLVSADHPARSKPKPPRFAAGSCMQCGAWYVVDRLAGRNLTDRYCAERCGRAHGRLARRARQKAAYVSVVRRQRIYERDGWRCHLCGKKVRRNRVVPHPLAPVLDHVIPLANGGTHEPANVRTAHFLCNSQKGDRGGGEQLALIG